MFIEYKKAGHGVYRVPRYPLLAEGEHSDLECRNVQEKFLPILRGVLFFKKTLKKVCRIKKVFVTLQNKIRKYGK